MNAFYTAIAYAFENIRTNFFHTVLSVLGIIIGVAALVSMLSMIDGLEHYAQDQIGQTSSIKVVEVSSIKTTTIDGISIKKDNPAVLTDSIHTALKKAVANPSSSYRVARMGKELTAGDRKIGSVVYYSDQVFAEKHPISYGSNLTNNTEKAMVVNTVFAKLIAKDTANIGSILGTSVSMDSMEYTILGIAITPSKIPELLVSIKLMTINQMGQYFPTIIFEAEKVEDVPAIKAALVSWLEASSFGKKEFSVVSNEFRVAQAAKGFMLFRLVMGFIIGISVVVGGVGVMNVMLITVTQRTNEVGIRKALGSRKKDIYIQFLTESMIISLFGTIVGIFLGILLALAVSPIALSITKMQFDPIFTPASILTISLVSILIGIIFGTFPAYKASRLDPIEAIRRE